MGILKQTMVTNTAQMSLHAKQNNTIISNKAALLPRTKQHCHLEQNSTVISNKTTLSSQTKQHCYLEQSSTVISNVFCERS